ncbi:hypothetical protein SAMN05877753_106129 [Bacillus oleivorans]|uniref:Uncharacterized protein n=1 Tax=Bacillus oleivorans TaxID=1448271 RepID=A0A285CYG6_9BACI|nr:hypothetical protein [Bacillus oleivorans]SNX72591.1 hypothetical protein SAMN05877753_106129 [Bacillus oleivorans]
MLAQDVPTLIELPFYIFEPPRSSLMRGLDWLVFPQDKEGYGSDPSHKENAHAFLMSLAVLTPVLI